MYRHLLIFPDGRELYSGAGQENVLQSVMLTETVNSAEELTLGSVCACELQAQLITPHSGLPIQAGEQIILYRVDAEENRHRIGTFWTEKPVHTTAHTMTLTAYDAVSLLDRNLTRWLAELDGWPYTVEDFAHMVCLQCGITLVETELPNGDFYIQPFAGENITGRHLLQWIGQITGRFCRATAEGDLEFAWYRPNNTWSVAPTQGPDRVFYYQGELSYQDYQVKPVEKIQLRQTSEDVGTVWPNEAGEKNTYVIENNPMLAAQNGETLLPVAKTLYAQLQNATYTPCRVVIPATPEICTGDMITVTDIYEKTFTFWVMKKTTDGQRDTLECTGSPRRDSTTAVNNLGFQPLSGKVLNLRTDVDGIKAENKDTRGTLAALQLDLEGIRSRVERQQTESDSLRQELSTMTQTAEGISIQVESILHNGAQKIKTGMGYTFDDAGIRINREGSQIENQLDHTGMYVRKSGENVLQATADGVKAVDITVKNYLIVGSHARFEDYTDGINNNRTACFYLEGGT